MIDIMQLEEFLDQARNIMEKETEEDKELKIADDEEADDVLGKIQWANSKIAKNKEKVAKKKEQLMKQLADWDEHMNKSLESYVEWQQGRLEAYVRDHLQNKKGGISLFNGDLKLTQPRIKYNYVNEDETLQWLKDHDFADCIRIKEELDKNKLKTKFKDTNESKTEMLYNGQAIPGVELELADQPVFNLKLRSV